MKSLRSMAILVGLAVSCGEDPKPLTVRVFWTDGCEADLSRMLGACVGQNHLVTGQQGAPNLAVDCTIRPALTGGGYDVFFQAGTLSGGATSFDLSSEGIAVNGSVAGAGREIDTGYAILRGNGWEVGRDQGTVGPTGACHIFVDGISGQSFRGRINCERVRSSEVPYRLRFIRGAAGQTMEPMFGEFSFQNCRTE
ncbi:MAG: hypothetical protein HY909_30160 [Deltaproteobacteria bacterium]|nr:hypothetical protein [Deltaproteobacteria bacterium]